MKNDNSIILRKTFLDISRGYSTCEYQDRLVYIKHPDDYDYVMLDDMRITYERTASENGMLTEAEMLKVLYDEGVWDKDKDHQIASLKNSIKNMQASRKHIYLVSQLKENSKQIAKLEGELILLNKERSGLMGLTVERYVDYHTERFFIFNSFYHDSEFKKKVFVEDVFDNLSSDDVADVQELFNKSCEHITEKNMKQLALQDFFQMRLSLCGENTYAFFGDNPVCGWTLNQIHLVSYGRIFKYALQKIEKIPDDIKDDPDKILDYANTIEKTREKIDEQSEKGHRFSSIVGATEDDVSNLQGSNVNSVNLSSALEQAKKEGKTRLDNKDMMKLFGS